MFWTGTSPKASISSWLLSRMSLSSSRANVCISLYVYFHATGSKRFIVLSQGERTIEVALNDNAAERTDESLEGHLVQIGPLTIVRIIVSH